MSVVNMKVWTRPSGSGGGGGVRPDTDLDAAPSLALPKLHSRAFPPTPLLPPRRPAAA